MFLGACLPGCSHLRAIDLPWERVPLDASAGFYQSASIEYRVDAGKLEQPLDVARIEGQRVVYEQIASSPLADESVGTLVLTYPHPGGRAGMAQAKFTIESAAGKSPSPAQWNPFGNALLPSSDASARVVTRHSEIREVWVLDIPAAESDSCFKLLAAQSFYNTQRPEGRSAQLSVTINGSQVSKPWDQVPEFDLLAQRIRSQGQLVAYSRPAAEAGRASDAIASVRAYDEMLARAGGPAPATAQRAPSPFAMPRPAAAQPIIAQGPTAVR
jgi:hypothetical protein